MWWATSFATMLAVYKTYLEPAKAYPALWRLILGLFTILVVYLLWTFAVFFVAWIVDGKPADLTPWLVRMASTQNFAGTVAVLGTFGGMALGPIVAARLLHGRGPRSLFGPAARTLHDFGFAMAVASVVLAASLVVWRLGNLPVPNLTLGLWLSLLPLTIGLVLVQTGAEELVFRGYLQSQLAARFASPFIWLLVPALLFGLAHPNPNVDPVTGLLIMGSASIFGFYAGDLTARTGSIGAAWGIHFSINFVAIGLLATQGTITGLSLFQTPYAIAEVSDSRGAFIGNFIVMSLIWIVVRRLLSR